MKKREKISIGIQVFMALAAVILIMAALFSPYGFYTNISSIRKSIDERLVVAATGVREFMGDDFHDRINAGEISQEEYALLQKKLSDFQKRVGVTYLYAMIQKDDGKIYFTLDQIEPMMTEYAEPSADTLQAFRTRNVVHAQCGDEAFNLVSRTVMIPFVSPKGQFYIVGADLNITEIRPLILRSLRDFIILMLVGVIIVAFVTMRLSKAISLPIKRLSDFTQKLAAANFSPELDMKKTVPPTIIKTREMGILASSIDAMRKKLAEYIDNLRCEAEARNIAESELKIAGEIQKSFLPGTRMENSSILAAADMKTAKKAGGDLYDFFEMDDGRTCFAIGDVSGKGMPAALFMARAMTLIRSAAHISASLPEMVKFINDLLSESNESCTFITFFICAYDPRNGNLEFVNCGHNLAYLKSADGKVRMLQEKANRILGVFGGVDFESENLKMEVGDMLFCYTDGVTEATAADSSFYGDDRLGRLLDDAPRGIQPDKIVALTMNSVVEFEKNCEQSDDITVLALKRKK